jgi:tripartite-type tricarboxylate transporter receptor subunit TctC
MHRPLALIGTAMLAALCATTSPAAEGPDGSYPARAIRMVVPFSAGGGTDVTARIVSQRMAENMGVPVVVDNRAGAGAMLGTEIVARAVPDGYTLITVASEHAINPSLQAKVPYDALRDFVPISQTVTGQYFLALNPNVPARSVKELISIALDRPGQMRYGSTGNGSATHLAAVLFQNMAGAKMIHVPYKGGGPASVALMGGEIDLVFNATSTVMTQVKSGKLRALAVTGPKRLSLLPQVPTVAEAGLPGYAVTGWYLVLAPAGTPRAIVDRLHAQIVKAVQHPTTKERIAALGTEPVGSSPDEARAFLRDEIEKWTPVVRASGAKAE